MKSAIVRPLIKKAGLNPELKNFRPVSNLSFLSKVLERVVTSRLVQHITAHNMNEPMQSAYRSGHNTETALLKIQSDLLQALDKRKAAVLVLLDLSAAFDTIDHDIMLNRLTSLFGITGKALQWLESYLTNRSQSVVIDGFTSNVANLVWGVPQGSVLGPILFTTYTQPLGAIARRHGISASFYADDTQLYSVFDPSNPDETVHYSVSLFKHNKPRGRL